ncbi:hypothetical protein AXG93_4689s1560 [Marchantia polymorpha subsp. ruderalis]|uniref:Rhodanese domain-containing protein n=1 Tax=Marchantia polymorpha subsp. ruderalis TaxID=1480154 RepID=A0A176WKU2_MARPO|nr:hypothetical protein AXG93_4689s1560 [Marchantia polymorpha subsp. ruderalis]
MAVASSIAAVSASSLRVSSAGLCVPGEADGLCLSSAGSLARPTGLAHQLARGVEGYSGRRVVIQACAREYSRRTVRVRVNNSREEYAVSIRSVPVQVARELLNAGHRYLDVRTVEEFAAGHVEGAVNVPYMYKAGAGMSKNLRFVDDVRKIFHKDTEIVVGCKSGRRSLMAAHELEAGEYTGVTDMVGGYDAWVESGLPVNSLQG